MSWVEVFIGLGSNLDHPEQQLRDAYAALQQWPECQHWRSSMVYSSPPMGPQDQPDYLNAVVACESKLSAMQILDKLQAQEQAQGRVRERHWGERSLDGDLLLYGIQQIDNERLTVPHPGMAERAFVLFPLQELASDLSIPGKGSLAELAKAFQSTDAQAVGAM